MGIDDTQDCIDKLQAHIVLLLSSKSFIPRIFFFLVSFLKIVVKTELCVVELLCFINCYFYDPFSKGETRLKFTNKPV